MNRIKVVHHFNCKKDDRSNTKFKHYDFFRKYLKSFPVNYLNPRTGSSNGNRKVIVLIHGYRGVYDKILNVYTRMTENIENYSEQEDVDVVYFFWPSSWSRTLGFYYAKQRTSEAARWIRRMISELESLGYQRENIILQGHSLGCEVIQKYILHETERFEGKVVLAAPAITNSYYEKMISDIDSNLVKNTLNENVNVVYSRNDPVLKYFFRLFPREHWSSPALGHQPSDIVMKTDMKFHDYSDMVNTHSGYSKLPQYYRDML